MVLYNFGLAFILAAAGIGSHLVGVALWPAVVLHAAMTVWCIMILLSGKLGGQNRPLSRVFPDLLYRLRKPAAERQDLTR